ncbi:transporter substrate-binding domain-containing protein [Bacillus sp. H-16]|uniref:transporter substrate-binding domain-containing protein n=1 Tax=Alteribacter salitolerans TaxID=2912333 RepID=UPI00196662D1|nr:transporter substrate-binding domain-containing protein [Alteribacter salitolerans]MBM7094768.1 transporter substrate-binding domain-containing protein [Alteribacter salitolerans]
MKKIVSLLSLSFLLGLAACSTVDEDTNEGADTSDDDAEAADSVWEEIQETGTLVVGTSGTYAPVTYHEDNELTGFDVELVREIADRLGVEAEFTTMDFDGIQPALRNGQIHLAANDFAITEDREEAFELTEPYKFSYGSVIVRAEDADRFETARDLEGVPVALGSLTSNYAQFAENIGADGSAYDGGTEAILRDVINGNRDAYLNDVLVLQRTVEEFGDDRLVVADQVKYHATESVMMMEKGNTDLKEAIDEAIAELHEDGTIAALSEEFLGADVSEPADTDEIVGLDGE